MTAPVIGMQFSRPDDEPVPVIGADFSKVVILNDSADASNTEFPIGMAKRGSSTDPDFLEALGTGNLADDVRGINDQLNGLNRGADITSYRIDPG
jgi:hypothetical protein